MRVHERGWWSRKVSGCIAPRFVLARLALACTLARPIVNIAVAVRCMHACVRRDGGNEDDDRRRQMTATTATTRIMTF